MCPARRRGGRWKPAREADAHALAAAAVPAAEALLVSVRPWDLGGAARAGLATAWPCRAPRPHPSLRHPADVTAASLPEPARKLTPRAW